MSKRLHSCRSRSCRCQACRAGSWVACASSCAQGSWRSWWCSTLLMQMNLSTQALTSAGRHIASIVAVIHAVFKRMHARRDLGRNWLAVKRTWAPKHCLPNLIIRCLQGARGRRLTSSAGVIQAAFRGMHVRRDFRQKQLVLLRI